MEKKTTDIKAFERIFCETREHTVACDILLPDYYPEIEKIVSCFLQPTEENVTLSGDKISVAGDAYIRVIYISSEKNVVAAEHNAKYTKIIPCVETKDGDCCYIGQNTAALHFKAVGPRKFEIRASIAIKSEIFRFSQSHVLSDAVGDFMQSNAANGTFFDMQTLSDTDFEIKSTVSLPIPRESVSAVLSAQALLNFIDVRSASNKLMLKGAAQISMTVLAKDGSIHQDLRYNLPFTEIKDAFGVREDTEISICIKNLRVLPDLRSSVGEEKEISITVCFSALFCTGMQSNVTYLRDAFALNGETKETRAALSMPVRVISKHETVNFSGSLQTDTPVGELLSASVVNPQFSIAVQEKERKLSLFADLQCYFKDKDGALCFTEKKLSSVIDKDGDEEMLHFVGITPASVHGEASGSQIVYSGSFLVDGFSAQCVTCDFLTDLQVLPSECMGSEKMVLYYAAAGESLWEIAKEYKTPVSSILGADAQGTDTLGEDKLLVFCSKA